MNILFICRHNRFRSKVAETIFKKLNKKKEIRAESAGILIDEARPYVAKNVVKIMRERGYFIGNKISRQITSDRINDYDLLIIVADNLEKEFFVSSGFKGKIICWRMSDCDENDLKGIRKRIKDIEKHTQKLIARLYC